MEPSRVGAYVGQCRRAVEQHIAGLRLVRGAPHLAHALHRSVSQLLHSERHRLEHSDLATHLPALLKADAQWAEDFTRSRRFESFVRLRASQWRRAIIELFNRLDADWELLVQHFALRRDAAVSVISAPLGDLHKGGRSVCRVDFEDGKALIYKPRQVEPEATFAELVRWFCRDGFEPHLTPCNVLPRADYGWMEYVPTVMCRSEAEADSYFERQGAFLLLFYISCARDCIRDNVVVCTDRPMWVDTECLCSPDLGPAVLVRSVPDWMSGSVLATSLVFHGNDEGYPPRLLSGLSTPCVGDASLVFSHDDVLRDRYIEAVVSGFRKAYDSVLECRHMRASDGGALPWGCEHPVRIIPRSTSFYDRLRVLLTAMPALRRAAAKERIAQVLHHEHGVWEWPDTFVRDELRALERGDVPYWLAAPAAWEVREAGSQAGPVRGVVQRTGMECVRQRATLLSQRDQDDQAWLIETFLRVGEKPASD